MTDTGAVDRPEPDNEFRDGRLTALRLGRTLATEVPATSPERRAFVSIRPEPTDDDRTADVEGWTRSDAQRTFVVRHDEYRVEHLDGMDYDVGMVRVRHARTIGEQALRDTIAEWGVALGRFDYQWRTDCP